MQRSIYHGSSRILRSPKFGSGNAASDFGIGFYCSESQALAEEWAASPMADGFVNRYLIETGGLRIINLNSPEYCILHWLAVLLNFREFDAGTQQVFRAKDYVRTHFTVDYQNCDVMIGFRADNCNFYFAQSFLNGSISYRQFNDAVRLGDTGRQLVIKSNRAFDRLIFDGYTIARSEDVYPAARRRDLAAMQRLSQSISRSDSSKGVSTGASAAGRRRRGAELYIDQILSESINAYDSRLRY